MEAWDAFVAEVEAGYAGDLYEYEDELSVRDDLETALSSHDLVNHAEWKDLRAQVIAIDDRLRRLLEGGPGTRPDSPWWRSRLPAHAGDELAKDAQRLFGVEVRSR